MTNLTPLLRKKLTYRDRSGKSQEEHREAWRGFRWTTGPYITACQGPWGTVQVWASSHAEGERVIRKALGLGGWSPDSEPGTVWNRAEVSSPRFGRVCTVETLHTRRGLAVSMRDGPDGPPNLTMAEGDGAKLDP